MSEQPMLQSATTAIELGRRARNAGDTAGALAHYREAAEILRTQIVPQRLAHTIRHVADLERELGFCEAAEAHYAEALAIYRDDAARTQPLDLANALRGYALLREQTNDGAGARDMWTEAAAIYRELGIDAGVAEAARRLADLGGA